MSRIRTSIAVAVGTSALLAMPATGQMPKDIDPVVVEIDSGKLSGEHREDVNIFRGVPYAAPPIGPLRWRSPQPVSEWPGIRAATAHEPACTQPVDLDTTVANFGGVNGAQSEDCLYLTIHAPSDTRDAPVIVWFHGGAFFLGSGSLGSYDGTANARQGVVTVGVNYRLGALANFIHPALNAEGHDDPRGNYALQDSVAALEWVRENIAAFGGNPDNVTIAGQSAGGGIVTNLLSLPSARGLFDKAIVQSGSLLLPDRDPATASAMAVEALQDIGVDGTATADELRAISAQTFAADTDLRAGFFFTSDADWKPTSTIAALRAGREIDVPVLVGSNAGEKGFAAARTLAMLAGDSGAPAYLYRFEHVPAFRSQEWTNGPIHSAELMFAFDSIDQSSWGGPQTDATDRALATAMNSCWVAFAKALPGTRGFTCAGDFEWAPYSANGETAAIRTGGPVIIDGRGLPDGPPEN